MPKPRKIPVRMCVGCRARNDKRNLLRVVRTPEQEVVVDPTGKRAGRGAYLCPRVECLRKAVKSRALERALGVVVSPEVLARLESGFNRGSSDE
ncbi:YlxR family protein [Moorella naiadis]|uniref:RNase P modulator RnpM n=1 Tax=Moorella naiadis (nom. illeg.) TaxID=3093670 RepID=UPI003D9CBE4C